MRTHRNTERRHPRPRQDEGGIASPAPLRPPHGIEMNYRCPLKEPTAYPVPKSMQWAFQNLRARPALTLIPQRECLVVLPRTCDRTNRIHRSQPRRRPRPTDFVRAGRGVGRVQPISFVPAEASAASNRFRSRRPRRRPRPTDFVRAGQGLGLDSWIFLDAKKLYRIAIDSISLPLSLTFPFYHRFSVPSLAGLGKKPYLCRVKEETAN